MDRRLWVVVKPSRLVAPVVAALALLGACDLFTGPGERVVGIIGVGEAGVFGSGGGGVAAAGAQDFPSRLDLPALEAPDTVSAGTPFDIVVRTLNCCPYVWADGTTVTTTTTGVEVVPYDRVATNHPDAELLLPRTVTLTLHEPGEVLLRVTGRVIVSEGEVIEETELRSIEHAIVVVP